MPNRNLTYGCKTVRSINATAAGTTAINGTGVDTLGFSSVRAVALLGTLTATQVTSLKLQGSTDNSTWVDLAGSSSGAAADADSNKMLISEVYRPGYRYIRPVVLRGTANAVVDGVFVELFAAAREPVTQDATVSQSVVKDYSGTGSP